jgi:hypothetical protein
VHLLGGLVLLDRGLLHSVQVVPRVRMRVKGRVRVRVPVVQVAFACALSKSCARSSAVCVTAGTHEVLA